MIYNQLGTLSENNLKILKVLLSQEKKYINSEELSRISHLKGKILGSTLSALSKIKSGNSYLIIPFGKKSLKVERQRSGKKVQISKPIQMWKINEDLFQNNVEVLKRIDDILEVLKN